MTASLKKVISRLSLLSDKEQNAIAKILSNELSWSKSFNESQTELASLARESVAEYKSGKTQSLNLK